MAGRVSGRKRRWRRRILAISLVAILAGGLFLLQQQQEPTIDTSPDDSATINNLFVDNVTVTNNGTTVSVGNQTVDLGPNDIYEVIEINGTPEIITTNTTNDTRPIEQPELEEASVPVSVLHEDGLGVFDTELYIYCNLLATGSTNDEDYVTAFDEAYGFRNWLDTYYSSDFPKIESKWARNHAELSKFEIYEEYNSSGLVEKYVFKIYANYDIQPLWSNGENTSEYLWYGIYLNLDNDESTSEMEIRVGAGKVTALFDGHYNKILKTINDYEIDHNIITIKIPYWSVNFNPDWLGYDEDGDLIQQYQGETPPDNWAFWPGVLTTGAQDWNGVNMNNNSWAYVCYRADSHDWRYADLILLDTVPNQSDIVWSSINPAMSSTLTYSIIIGAVIITAIVLRVKEKKDEEDEFDCPPNEYFDEELNKCVMEK